MAPTREHVQWCYRLLLGREPESDAAIDGHLSGDQTDLKLVQSVLNSPEFRRRLPEFSSLESRIDLLRGTPLEIDSVVTREDLVALVRRTQACWAQLGDDQPHWSVLSDEQFRPYNIDKSIGIFWESGRLEYQRLIDLLGRHGFSNPDQKACIDYGCGIGRVTSFLAQFFRRAYGYDISENHLNHARRHAVELGLKNVSYRSLASDPFAPLEKCDVFYSRLVFQHNPPPLIRNMIAAGLSSLKNGGIAVFQVPTYIVDYSFKVKGNFSAPPRENEAFEIHCFPQNEVFKLARAHGCDVLEVHEDGAAGRPDLCVSNLFVLKKARRRRWF